MDNNKIIIILLLIIIGILLLLIGTTIFPSMNKEDCRLEITSPDSLNEGDNLTVKLSDAQNQPLSGKTVKISLKNSSASKEYAVTTDSNGTAVLTLSEENIGTFNVTCSFEGDETYKETSTSKEITVSAVKTASITDENSIEANRPRNDPNYKGYTPNHESEIVNGWNPAEHETYREKMSDGTIKIHYDDGYFRLVDENGYVITYGYGG